MTRNRAGNRSAATNLKYIALIVVAVCVAAVALVFILKGNGTLEVERGKARISVDRKAGAPSTIVIQFINAKHPDYIILKNVGTALSDVSGWILREGNNKFVLPQETSIPAGGTVTIYLFSPKEPDKMREADAYRDKGYIVCDTFGISPGETVELATPDEDVVDSKTAN